MCRFNKDSPEQFDLSQVLGEHVGGSAIRAVTSVTGCFLCKKHCLMVQDKAIPAESFGILISVGAKEVLTSWLLEWEVDLDNRGQEAQILSSRWLSTKRSLKNKKPPKVSQEHANVLVQDNETYGRNALLEDINDDDLRYLAVTSFAVLCPHTRFFSYRLQS